MHICVPNKYITFFLESPKIYKSNYENNSSQNTTEIDLMLGQSFFLHCHPLGNPAPHIYWFKDDILLRLFNDKMKFMDFGEILVFNEAEVEHSGNYTCIAKNKLGEESITYLINVLGNVIFFCTICNIDISFISFCL